jgi:cytosine deaminase
MLDLVIRNANLPDGRRGYDIAVQDGRVKELSPAIGATPRNEIDAAGCLVTPPFVAIGPTLASARKNR